MMFRGYYGAVATLELGNRWLALLLPVLLVLVLGGCQLSGPGTTTDTAAVGPAPIHSTDNPAHSAHSNSAAVYLDVAIPVFDPGLRGATGKSADQAIWPQLRRAEAKRFALMSKKALLQTAAFGQISVVPDPESSADVYLLGRIDGSTSEVIRLTIEVVDIGGRRWGKKTFKHTVSADFYQSSKNVHKDAYEPVFNDIAAYVVKLLKQHSAADKTTLKQLSELRFAHSLAPQAFSRHLASDDKGHVTLVSLPHGEDPMVRRIAALRTGQQLFVDRLQSAYEGFNVKIGQDYLLWQYETLTALLAARNSENRSMFKGIAGGVMLLFGAIGKIFGGGDDLERVGSELAVMAGGYLLKESLQDSAEAKVQRAMIDEMGESVDISMDPQVVLLDGQIIELSGSIQAQYEQYKAHLQRIFELEKTADKML